jgi:hypothetical protein
MCLRDFAFWCVCFPQVRTSETNSLYELDKATQEVVSSLVEAQAQGVGGVIRSVPIGEGLPVISSFFVLCILWSFHPSKH